ncbi:radical SAM protein [Rhodobacteraceae bacterium NNCM2]|nr:radical SAM protein [Coraliihabitans acroporae]
MLHTYFIEVTGTCNLRCPSCPTGNMRINGNAGAPTVPVGFMSLERVSEVLEKISEETGGKVTRIALYNWGEPLLHPEISKIIELVRSYKHFQCTLSSNLSLEKVDLRRVVRAAPHSLRISLSGNTQGNYQFTHARGDIRLVKANMYRLRYEMDRQGISFPVDVAYHLYRHNAGSDLEGMQSLCEELNFKLLPFWAAYYPVEKFMALEQADFAANADRDVIDLLAITPEERHRAAKRHRRSPCLLQSNQTSINFDGSVQLCCATYDRNNLIATNFLETDLESRALKKSSHITCDKCIAGGFHAVMMDKGLEDLEEVANARLEKDGGLYEFRSGYGLVRREMCNSD